MVVDALAVVLSGFAIFLAPGAALLGAARLRVARGEYLAYAFAASLTLLATTFAGLLSLPFPISLAPPNLLLVTLVACGLARLLPSPAPDDGATEPAAPLFPRLVLLLLVAAAIAAAIVFAPVGSVDRWWYLAYVRSFAEAPLLSLGEPFFGSGEPFARFGVHPWLFGLSLWTSVSGVDAVAIYENAAPVIVVLASLSAATALARELFANATTQRLAVVASVLAWCGGLVPLLARAGEDKILGAGALLPLGVAALLRVLRGPGDARDVLLLALVAVATASVHALDYALLLGVALPVLALALVRGRVARRAAVLAVVVLLAAAVMPAADGLVVRSRLQDIGADLSAADHPVVRVHEGRDRLVEVPGWGYAVSPRLLLHPLFLLALLAVPLPQRRRPDDEAAVADGAPQSALRDETARDFLLIATLLPALVAFAPPAAMLASSVIPPWMVYRVLWLIPAAPLAAVAVQGLAKAFGHGEAAATLALLLLCAPVIADSAHDRFADARGRLAVPRSAEFLAAMDAVRALPRDAVVVAAPELSERLPALTGRHVLAGLDRSTLVFSGDRGIGEARLAARAALLTGDDDAVALAARLGLTPTHALFDPHGIARPRCESILGAWGDYALCRLDPTPTETMNGLAVLFDLPEKVISEGACTAAAPSSRRDPWSASVPVVDCRLAVPQENRGSLDLFLRIDSATGRAADVLRVVVRLDGTIAGAAVPRVSGEATRAIALPLVEASTIDVRITSSFLPFVDVRRVALMSR